MSLLSFPLSVLRRTVSSVRSFPSASPASSLSTSTSHLSSSLPSISLLSTRSFSSRPERLVSVLLLRDIARLGLKGEVVKVRPGFARHSLVLNGSAVYNTRENRRRFEMTTGEMLPEPRSGTFDDGVAQSDDSALLRRKYLESEKRRLNRITLRLRRPPNPSNARKPNQPVTRGAILRILSERHACAGLMPEQIITQPVYEDFGRYEIVIKLDRFEKSNKSSDAAAPAAAPAAEAKEGATESAAAAAAEASDEMLARISLSILEGTQPVGVKPGPKNKIIRRPRPQEAAKPINAAEQKTEATAA